MFCKEVCLAYDFRGQKSALMRVPHLCHIIEGTCEMGRSCVQTRRQVEKRRSLVSPNNSLRNYLQSCEYHVDLFRGQHPHDPTIFPPSPAEFNWIYSTQRIMFLPQP